MLINNKQLTKLLVITKSGKKIGKIIDFNIDIDSQSILSYTVKPIKLIQGLFKGNLLINRGQVIDIQKDKVIIEDSFSKKEKSPMRSFGKITAKQEKSATLIKTSSK